MLMVSSYIYQWSQTKLLSFRNPRTASEIKAWMTRTFQQLNSDETVVFILDPKHLGSIFSTDVSLLGVINSICLWSYILSNFQGSPFVFY